MIRTEYLEALGDLGYSQQESRFLYLAATHSGCFTLRQFLYFTATAKGWNVHQFTSKSIRLGHVRVATCGYRASVFNLYSRKVYGALDRDKDRKSTRLNSSHLVSLHDALPIFSFPLSCRNALGLLHASPVSLFHGHGQGLERAPIHQQEHPARPRSGRHLWVPCVGFQPLLTQGIWRSRPR